MKYIRLFFSKETLYRCDYNFLMSKLIPYIISSSPSDKNAACLQTFY